MIELCEVVYERPGAAAPVLDGIGFRIAPAERVALVGGNGSGKTTLARLLNGTLLPTRGTVTVDGHDTRDVRAQRHVRRTVGLLFQDPDDQFVTTTAEREVAFGLENLQWTPAAMRAAVDAALERFQVAPQAEPHALSGGEKARLALACMWVMQPRVLVLDETESLLDRRGRERLEAAIAALPSDTAVLRLTTDVEAAAASARLLVLHGGRLAGDGPPDEVLAALPEAVLARIGAPILWQVAQQLAAAGRVQRPTASWDRLVTQLGWRAGPGGAAC